MSGKAVVNFGIGYAIKNDHPRIGGREAFYIEDIRQKMPGFIRQFSLDVTIISAGAF